MTEKLNAGDNNGEQGPDIDIKTAQVYAELSAVVECSGIDEAFCDKPDFYEASYALSYWKTMVKLRPCDGDARFSLAKAQQWHDQVFNLAD